MAGSVIDATGCKITYALSCTNQKICSSSSDLIVRYGHRETITPRTYFHFSENGHPSWGVLLLYELYIIRLGLVLYHELIPKRRRELPSLRHYRRTLPKWQDLPITRAC